MRMLTALQFTDFLYRGLSAFETVFVAVGWMPEKRMKLLIINQKDSGIRCVYVAIGQKQSTIANVAIEEIKARVDLPILTMSGILAPAGGCQAGSGAATRYTRSWSASAGSRWACST